MVGTSGTTVFPHEWYEHIETIFDNLESNVPADDEILRSLRWYSRSTIQDDDTDAFLSLWLSLEILSDKQKKTIPELDSDSGDPVEEGMEAIRQNVDSTYLKQEINSFIAERLRDESIPESIERELRETLGEQHSIVGEGLLPRLKQMQRDRSNLVHDGEPIDDLKNKKSRLDRIVRFLLKSKLDTVFTGEYDSDFFWEGPQIPFENTLHLVMSQYDRPLELDEIEKEVVAANRDIQVLEEAMEAFSSSTHEKIGVEEVEDGKYQFVGYGYTIGCPVCDEGFETRYLLAYHLAWSDVDRESGSDFHEGAHGSWREDEGFPADEPATNAIEGWIQDSDL